MVLREHPDRPALRVGVRVQLSFVKHAPYTQRADLSVSDRLGVVVEETIDGFVVDDGTTARSLAWDALEEPCDDPGRGRWRVEGAIPSYAVGERLLLRWRHRGGAVPAQSRDDAVATVVAEAASTVAVVLPCGRDVTLFRWGAQADEPDRRAPRWFVVARLGRDDAPLDPVDGAR
jgi:hypothetical protein